MDSAKADRYKCTLFPPAINPALLAAQAGVR